MDSIFNIKKQYFMESLMKICNMDSNYAQIISDFVSKNQIIRPICNEPFIYGKKNNERN